MPFGACVKSSVIVGNGADADSVAIDANGLAAIDEPMYPAKCVDPSLLVLEVEPERRNSAAADVVFVVAVASGGRGWLWFPS